MNFRTQIPLKKQEDHLITYHSRLLLLGSCFSENIGAKFEYYKFQHTINPVGILFHPKAIETFLSRVINQQFYTEDELVFQNEQYHCLDAHSSISSPNKDTVLKRLNDVIKLVYKEIIESTHLLITLGTAWVYEYIATDKTVANCHKISQKQFRKRILTVQEVKNSLDSIEYLVKTLNSEIQFIYTVSPVRHIKDGFIENQQSKAHLLTAIHEILRESAISYFPSYEMMMDDLRDYRFYNSDMIHPNELAIDYIWEQFQKVWLANSVTEVMKQVSAIQKGLAHKPFNPESEQHQLFLKSLKEKILTLQSSVPFIKF